MKNLIIIIKRFIPKYKWYAIANVFMNILSTIFNLFSFASIIPILQILFGLTTERHTPVAWSGWGDFDSLKEFLINNAYAYIEGLIDDYGAATALLMLGVYLIVMTFFKTMTAFLSGATLVPIHTGVLRDLRKDLYDKILSLPIGYFSNEKKGDLMTRMTNDVVEVETSIVSSLETLFKNPLMIAIYIAVLFTMSWRLTLFVLILLPISGILIGKIGKSLKKKSMKGQQLSGELLSLIEETLSGLRIVKAFNAEKHQAKRFSKTNETLRMTLNKINIKYLLAHPVSEFLGTTVIAILLWYGGMLILDGDNTLSAPVFIYYLVIFYSIIQPFKDLSKAGYNVQKGMASLERIDFILNAESNIKQPKNPVKIKEFSDSITLNNVWFKYSEDWILKDINLKINKGETVALVGQSGGGKSTLVDLIPRFYDCQKGNICIDGIDIKDLTTTDLRDIMGNVNQEAILFNDTIYNNITFGTENATREDVERAAKMANAHDFIMASEAGYETNIGDRGTKLSGGQRQRISIARALLKNPPILILDEATSALDTESERLVQNAIDKLMKNRTSIVIAHRLSTIKTADKICVIHEGRIVESGKHDELMQLNGYYRKLNDLQK